MFNKKSTLFGAVIGIAVGLLAANIAQINNNSQEVMTNDLVERSPIYGHITVIEKSPKGDIVAYRQSDNLIVNQGLNCMGVALFRVAMASASADRDACGGTEATATITTVFGTASGFRWIEIGSSNVAPDASQDALQAGLTQSTVTGSATFNPSVSTLPTITELGTGTGGTTAGVGPIVIVSASNLGVGTTGTAETIDEVGLFDSEITSASATSTANMFARQTFAPITMSKGDSLSVTWEITLAHG